MILNALVLSSQQPFIHSLKFPGTFIKHFSLKDILLIAGLIQITKKSLFVELFSFFLVARIFRGFDDGKKQQRSESNISVKIVFFYFRHSFIILFSVSIYARILGWSVCALPHWLLSLDGRAASKKMVS